MNTEKMSNEAETPALNKGAVSSSFFYEIVNTGMSSNYFGNCEICGKQVSEVFHQKRFKNIMINNRIGRVQISDGYGHKECLVAVR